jgi:hypothetical protein
MGKFVLIIISWRSFTSADATENHTQKLCTNKVAAQAFQCHSMTVQMLLTTTWTYIAHRCAMPSSAVCQNALLCVVGLQSAGVKQVDAMEAYAKGRRWAGPTAQYKNNVQAKAGTTTAPAHSVVAIDQCSCPHTAQ